MSKRISQFPTIEKTDNTTFIPVIIGNQPVNRKISIPSITKSLLDDVKIELDSINNNITGETENRILADIVLHSEITGETENRINNDLSLLSALTGEAESRISADIALHNEITGGTEMLLSIIADISGNTDGGSVTNQLIEKTYSELVDLITNSQLIQGANYLITDFQSVYYTIPLTPYVVTKEILTGSTEPLIVTAISSNNLKTTAFSNLYPQDVIYYDWNPDNWIGDGSLSTSGQTIPGFKGVITYRCDTKNNNSTYYDFRNIKFRRYYTYANAYDSEKTYNKGESYELDGCVYYVTDIDKICVFDFNLISTRYISSIRSMAIMFGMEINYNNYQDFYTFSGDYNKYSNVHIGSSRGLSIGYYLSDNVFMPYNTIPEGVVNISSVKLSSGCMSNTFIVDFLVDITCNMMVSSSILNHCLSDNFDMCIGNIICSDNQNSKHYSLSSSIIGSSCTKINTCNNDSIFIGSYTNSIDIENSSNNITIGDSCNNISIGFNNSFINIGNNANNITIKNECSEIILPADSKNDSFNNISSISQFDETSLGHITSQYECNILLAAPNNVILTYFDSTSGLTYTNITI